MDIQLRSYQLTAIQSLFNYLCENPDKNPCLVASVGAGKSIIQAAFIKQAMEWWPKTRVLVVTHQKELVMQDAKKLHALAPEIPIGIYSAALKQKSLEEPVIYASIQSIYKKVLPVSCVIIDEAHMINNTESGMYRKFLDNCKGARIIGMTATPYRLGQGLVTDSVEGSKPLFDDLIEVASIAELQEMGFLAKLRSKKVANGLDLSGLHLRGGEFTESEMDEKLNTYNNNDMVTDEIIESAELYDRHHWLIFCSSIKHATDVAEMLKDKGIRAAVVHGNMSQEDRDDVLWLFTHGEIEALTNVSILTTGFDYPEIDLIAMLRPTMSPGLYVQCCGRGLRLKEGPNKDCLLLDFAGNVMRHGPVTMVRPPKKKGEGDGGPAPCKECPQCMEIVPATTKVCPCCGFIFPANDRTWMLFDGDVNGDGTQRMEIRKWDFIIMESRKSGKSMIRVDYTDPNMHYFSEYYCVFHELGSYARGMGVKGMRKLCKEEGIEFPEELVTSWDKDEWQKLLDKLIDSEPPLYIFMKPDANNPKYKRITHKLWAKDVEEILEEKKRLEEIGGRFRRSIHTRRSAEAT